MVDCKLGTTIEKQKDSIEKHEKIEVLVWVQTTGLGICKPILRRLCFGFAQLLRENWMKHGMFKQLSAFFLHCLQLKTLGARTRSIFCRH